MVSNLRYIEGDEHKFELDLWFQEKIKTFSREDVYDILSSIIDNIEQFDSEALVEDYISGVIKRKDPLFYTIDYVIDEDSVPILLDIQEIDVDEYLDSINNNKYLKSNETRGDRKDSEDS